MNYRPKLVNVLLVIVTTVCVGSLWSVAWKMRLVYQEMGRVVSQPQPRAPRVYHDPACPVNVLLARFPRTEGTNMDWRDAGTIQPDQMFVLLRSMSEHDITRVEVEFTYAHDDGSYLGSEDAAMDARSEPWKQVVRLTYGETGTNHFLPDREMGTWVRPLYGAAAVRGVRVTRVETTEPAVWLTPQPDLVPAR